MRILIGSQVKLKMTDVSDLGNWYDVDFIHENL